MNPLKSLCSPSTSDTHHDTVNTMRTSYDMECVPNTTKTQINTYKCKNKYSHSWQTKTIHTREACTKCTCNNKSTIHNQDRQSNYGEKNHNKIKNVRFTNNVHK